MTSALETARDGVAAHPESAVLRNNLAVLLEIDGDLAGAEAMLRAAFAEEPTLPQISKNLGDLLYRAGRYEEAMEAYERAAKPAPNWATTCISRWGTSPTASGTRSGPRTCWRRATAINPAPPAGANQPRYPRWSVVTAADDPGFDRLAQAIARRAGLAVESYKPRCIRRRIAVRMRANAGHHLRKSTSGYSSTLRRNTRNWPMR